LPVRRSLIKVIPLIVNKEERLALPGIKGVTADAKPRERKGTAEIPAKLV